MIARIQSGGTCGQLARVRDDGCVGPRVAQRHVVPVIRLSEHRDGLGVPSPARGEVRRLHLDRLGSAREHRGPFRAGIVRQVAVEQRMRADERRLRGQRRLDVRLVRRGVDVQVVVLMQTVRGQIAVVVAHSGDFRKQRCGAVAALDAPPSRAPASNASAVESRDSRACRSAIRVPWGNLPAQIAARTRHSCTCGSAALAGSRSNAATAPGWRA